MSTIHFLEASSGLPLTKSFSKNDKGEIEKTSYPMVRRMNSHVEQIETIEDLFEVTKDHAAKGHCLLKGQLDRPLTNESRAGHTNPDGSTDLLVLDNDYLPDLEPQALLDLIGLGDVDYVLQYSASAGIEKLKQKYHIFMLLDRLHAPADLKLQLKHWNLTIPEFRKHIALTSTTNALTYPLDVTICQNDKLIFIAPPICGPGVTDVLGDDRIKLVKRTKRVATLGELCRD